jgi:hypothetical protein
MFSVGDGLLYDFELMMRGNSDIENLDLRILQHFAQGVV